MTVHPAHDVSLYELALGTNEALVPLQVSPSTLKSVVDSTLDLLIEQAIAATIWAKLPRGDVWQTELLRYSQAVPTASIYLYSQQRDDVPEEIGSGELPEGLPPRSANALWEALPGGQGLDLIGDTAESMVTTLPSDQAAAAKPALTSILLTPDSPLKREYFLVVLAPQFCHVVLAHRPRSRQLKPDGGGSGTVAAKPLPLAMGGALVEDEPGDRKQPLLTLSSFDPTLVQAILPGLQQIKGVGGDLADPTQLDWPTWITQSAVCVPNPLLLSQLFGKQIQHQEDFWHRSVGHRKQAELAANLQVQNESLQQAIRLKDEFLNNVGQELRTPLTTMKTALTLLNSAQLKPAQRQRYMQMLSTECDRQSSLITSLLDLIQLEHAADNTAMQPIQVTDVVPGVVSTYQPLAQEKGVMLAYTVPENLPAVSCLSTWLKQIAINLIHNGIKFTPTGGQVWVRAKQQGDYLQLEFRDTGIGIPVNEIPKIFDRFYRVRQAEDYGGAGLGLTIVQQILLRCGGSVSVKSKPGEGSAFNVLLPIYRA